MSFFKADHKEAKGFDVLPAGSYECFIESGTCKSATTGAPGIQFKLKVRDDVEGQLHGGRVLFGKLWFTENTTGIIQGFLKSIGVPDGKEFATAEEMRDYAVGRAILAKVVVKEYKGEDQNEVSYMNESKVGGGKVSDPFDVPSDDPFKKTSVDDDPFATGGGPIEVSDDDMPF